MNTLEVLGLFTFWSLCARLYCKWFEEPANIREGSEQMAEIIAKVEKRCSEAGQAALGHCIGDELRAEWEVANSTEGGKA